MRFGMRSGLLAAGALALVCSGPASATDIFVPAKITIVKDAKLFKLVAKPAAGTFAIPAFGGSSDPQINDSSLEVFMTGGAGSMSDTLATPWTGLGNPAGSKGYKYKNALAGPGTPVKIIIVKGAVIKVIAKDDGSLNGPLAGNVGIRLNLGTDRYCAEAPNAMGGDIKKDQAGLVKVKDSPAPTACPDPFVAGPCCNSESFLSFTTSNDPGDCGDVRDATGALVHNINCAGLYTGGGQNAVPLPYAVPDEGSAVTKIASCATATAAAVTGTSSSETGSNYNCTNPGCRFGAPLTVPNPGNTATSVCVLNNVATAPSGTVDCSSGATNMSIPLSSIVYLVGDTLTDGGIQPCPLCKGGTLGVPGSGTCDGGKDHGDPCVPQTTPLNPGYPTSNDCEPHTSLSVGTLPVAFSLTTGSIQWNATTATNDPDSTVAEMPRIFAGYCRDRQLPGASGAFQNPAKQCWQNGMVVGTACGSDATTFETCQQRDEGGFGPNGGATRTILAIGNGMSILAGPAPATLISVFAVAPTFDPIVDGTGNLPGPGAVALTGTARICSTANPCP